MITTSELLQWVLGELEEGVAFLQTLDTTNPDDQNVFAREVDERILTAIFALSNECADGPGWVIG